MSSSTLSTKISSILRAKRQFWKTLPSWTLVIRPQARFHWLQQKKDILTFFYFRVLIEFNFFWLNVNFKRSADMNSGTFNSVKVVCISSLWYVVFFSRRSLDACFFVIRYSSTRLLWITWCEKLGCQIHRKITLPLAFLHHIELSWSFGNFFDNTIFIIRDTTSAGKGWS